MTSDTPMTLLNKLCINKAILLERLNLSPSGFTLFDTLLVKEALSQRKSLLELAYNQQNPKQKPPPRPQKPASSVKKVQAVDVFDVTNPTHVNIPDEFGDAFNHIHDKYVNAISSTSSFNTTRPCAVCDKPGHTFDDCPVLQNVDFLLKLYIQFKLFLKK